MARILVAEDSPTQAVSVRALLEKAGHTVDLVSDGRDALHRLEAGDLPDLVLTDMMMPEMDGLELVRAIRVHFSDTPVILMTGQGTDALAIEALQDGAAGYVPKSQLGPRLTDEVAQVLHAATADRSYEMLLGCLRRNEFSFELRNDVSLINPLVDLIQQMLSGMRLCDSTGRLRVGVALEHAMLNALYRGNLEISPQEMANSREQLLQTSTPAVVLKRLAESPYSERQIFLDVHISGDEAKFVIRDEGPGFDTSRVPQPGDPEAMEREGGHGLLLMQTFMDAVVFNSRGNEVTLTKRRDS